MDAENNNDFESRLSALAQSVDKVVELMRTESDEARRALALYPRARKLVNSFLRQASGHQTRACHLGQQLSGFADELKNLHRHIDARPGQDAERAQAARRELHRIARQIRSWQVESDGLQ